MARARKAASTQPKARPRSDFEDKPELRKLTARQASYLEEISGVPAEKLVAKPLGELDEILRWKIDPHLLLFRKVCGRVVRVEPGTGVIQGVPNATVHVEDTDCSFLGFFPVEGPFWWLWWWFWPIFCHREEIAYDDHRRVRPLLRLDPALGYRPDPALPARAGLLPVLRQADPGRPAEGDRPGTGRAAADQGQPEPARSAAFRAARA